MFLYLIKQNKLTMKTYSSLSNINKGFYSKFRKPILQKQFSKKVSQNPEYVKTICKDFSNPLHFASRSWMVKQ